MDPHSSKPCCSRVSCLYFKLWWHIPENEHTTVPLATTQWVDGGHCRWRGHKTRLQAFPAQVRFLQGGDHAVDCPNNFLSLFYISQNYTLQTRSRSPSHRQLPSPWHMATVRGEPKRALYFIFTTSKRNQEETFFPVKFNFTSVGQTNTCPLIIAGPKLLSLYCRTHVHVCTVTGRTRVPVSGMACEHITSPRGLNGLIQCEWRFLGTDLML